MKLFIYKTIIKCTSVNTYFYKNLSINTILIGDLLRNTTLFHFMTCILRFILIHTFFGICICMWHFPAHFTFCHLVHIGITASTGPFCIGGHCCIKSAPESNLSLIRKFPQFMYDSRWKSPPNADGKEKFGEPLFRFYRDHWWVRLMFGTSGQ